MEFFDQLSDLSLWQWVIETVPPEYAVYGAIAMLVGVVFRVFKPVLDWVVELVARIGNFIWYVLSHAFSSKVRENERRALRKIDINDKTLENDAKQSRPENNV